MADVDIGARLRAVRDAAGIALPALAAASGVSEDSLLAFESGGVSLPATVLVRAARFLHVPVGTFLHQDAAQAMPTQGVASLLRAVGFAGLGPADHLIIDRGLEAARLFAELNKVVGRENLADEYIARAAPKTKPYLKGYEAAEAVRKKIDNISSPIRNLRLLIEDNFGTLVLFANLSDSRVMGLAARLRDARLVVVSTAQMKETTRRFLLAHELGHALFDLPDQGAMVDEEERKFSFDKSAREKRADAFAAMLIAPRSGIQTMLGQPSKESAPVSKAYRFVNNARKTFGLGFESMAWHLKNLGYFDDEIAKRLISKPDSTTIEGFEDNVECAIERRLRFALSQDLISSGRAAEIRTGCADLY